MLELERTGVENYVARRQVIHLKPNLWLVLDSTSGSEKSQCRCHLDHLPLMCAGCSVGPEPIVLESS